MATAHRQLLDPIGSMCKIIPLIFQKSGSKIAITDHVIEIQGPGQLQWLARFNNSHSRENISELYIVIVRIIEWYIIPSNTLDGKMDNENSENNEIFYNIIRKFAEYVCIAFETLQRTYINEKTGIFGKDILYGNVIFALQYYILLLKQALAGTFTSDMLPSYISEHEKISKNFIDFAKVKTLWDNKKLQRLCELFENCFKTSEDKTESPEIKEKLIEGYLVTIQNILSLTDSEFRELIKHSNAA